MGCARIRRKSWKVSESEQRSSVNFEITSNFSKALSSAMEITSEGASNVELKPLSNIVLGRGSGCITTDLTVSCRHMLFWLGDCSNGTKTEPRAYFQVIRKNPIWVQTRKSTEATVGDWLCIGVGQCRQPIWFAV
ncbi:hypothetical protein WN944_015253 [Citrus x changshan-huyou]|uniref:FHA domain-containing protein n=1 Tax=Citrus x changshan-huyou TaxID=2935761 RepID=A0AAP0QJF6_9ROSI